MRTNQAHVVVRRTGSIDPCHESGCVPDLARLRQDILIGSVDLPGGSRRCDGEVVATCPEVLSARGRGVAFIGLKELAKYSTQCYK